MRDVPVGFTDATKNVVSCGTRISLVHSLSSAAM